MAPSTDPRQLEADLVARCADVVQGRASSAASQAEANVFALAAQLLPGPDVACSALRSAAEAYFAAGHQTECLAIPEVLRRGWILGLARFRDTLQREIGR